MIFETDTSYEDSKVIYLPVPWEATVSYGKGTAHGPAAIQKASRQLDVTDDSFGDATPHGLHILPISGEILETSRVTNDLAAIAVRTGDPKTVEAVNLESEKMIQWVQKQSQKVIEDGKFLAVIGGDHSSPLGAFKAISESVQSFGILHIDAHMDLRKAYQGFKHSHASIMYNALQECRSLEKIVQVGIRDYSDEELVLSETDSRLELFSDDYLKSQEYKGHSWESQCLQIIESLPENIWVSFDIDGLDPKLCPNTGTPVPGGLEFKQATFLLRTLAESRREILGFDLCEVAPSSDPKNEWDANVGMRMLYQLTGWTLVSNGLLSN